MSQGTFLLSFVKLGQAVKEEMLFKGIVEGACTQGRMPDAGQRAITIAHHEHFVLR